MVWWECFTENRWFLSVKIMLLLGAQPWSSVIGGCQSTWLEQVKYSWIKKVSEMEHLYLAFAKENEDIPGNDSLGGSLRSWCFISARHNSGNYTAGGAAFHSRHKVQSPWRRLPDLISRCMQCIFFLPGCNMLCYVLLVCTFKYCGTEKCCWNTVICKLW